jgi:hypothetical protein
MEVLMYERRSYPVVDKKGKWVSHSRLPMNFGLVESNAKHLRQYDTEEVVLVKHKRH